MRIGAWLAVGAMVALGAGCTSVRMVQRDGCWIRHTEKFPGRVLEEVGPCAKAEPRWSEDRITRLVQECVAHEDYRWQTHALEAFSKNQPIPAQRSEGEVLHACIDQAAATMVTENDALKNRIGELAEDRAQYKRVADEDRAFFREHSDKMASALGEAAKRPGPSAVATATSSGTATTRSTQSSQSSRQSTRSTSQRSHSAGPNPALTVAPKATGTGMESRVADHARPAPVCPAQTPPNCEPWWSGVGGAGSPAVTPALAPVPDDAPPATK
ncbi:MAG: hypothetical protein IRZ16_21455 [Myxococcaceae bacterium]|nr:hypothetical protein [Myxococcaceae bacterium]